MKTIITIRTVRTVRRIRTTMAIIIIIIAIIYNNSSSNSSNEANPIRNNPQNHHFYGCEFNHPPNGRFIIGFTAWKTNGKYNINDNQLVAIVIMSFIHVIMLIHFYYCYYYYCCYSHYDHIQNPKARSPRCVSLFWPRRSNLRLLTVHWADWMLYVKFYGWLWPWIAMNGIAT